jgi:cytochrome c peroxidase
VQFSIRIVIIPILKAELGHTSVNKVSQKPLFRSTGALACSLVFAGVLTGCGGASGDALPPTIGGSGAPATSSTLSPQAALGEKIFHDGSLSANGTISCASCHDPDHAFAGATASNVPVPLAGASNQVQGFRNAPSLRYLQANPAFFFDDEGTPTGGFDRDGRANSLQEQAQRPFLAAHEMANASVADVASKLSHAAYAAEFRQVFGDQVFADPATAFARALLALQKYEQEDTEEFAPYSSKYDAFIAGRTKLSAQETRGLALFNDPQKGNCAGCHPSARGSNGEPPLFTDFTYDNLGVPRNPDIAANDDPAYFDLGLCGPDRTDLADRSDLCGAFKVPTLRNVAITAPYFHNGRFETLVDLVRFYVRRDTNPEEWYPLGPDGQPQKFNDLPPDLVGNVNTVEVPYNRHPGDLPALDETEIQDLVAFLQTLTDGFQP